MAITVNKRPASRCWSGNPIHYLLYSAAADADNTIYFEIRVKFKSSAAAAYSNILEFPYKPVLGTAKIDIQDILDGLLEHELPYLPEDTTEPSPHISYKATGQFYIEFREITTSTPDPSWTTTESSYARFVAKGGLSFEKWRGDNYWANYFDVSKPFLTWMESDRMRSFNDLFWLAWLNLTDIPEYDIKMLVTTVFTDGSENVQTLDNPVPVRAIGYFPAGADQLQLDEIDATKTIYYWELQVINGGTNPEEPLSMAFRIYLDNRNDYNDMTLQYRNSLGGLDPVRVRGVVEMNSQRDFTQIEKVVLNDYYEGHYIQGRIAADNSTEVLIYKGDIGHLGKEEQDRLRDLHLKREVWMARQMKWLPVMLLTPSAKLRTTEDKLFSMPLEWCIASGGNYYYTPDAIDLQDGEEPVELACTAVIGSLASSYSAGVGWTVTWALVSGSPVKYFISTPAVSGGAPGETTSLSYLLPWLPVGENVITVQPVCYIGGVYYLGAAQTITITVAAACVGVGINAEPVYLPDAIAGTAYSYVLNLTGTAPFSIGSIVKPSWMSITVVGSTVEITGTPGGGDIGTGIEVSFLLTNCSGGNTKSFSDYIDVVVPADNGVFEIVNDGRSGSFVKKVMPDSPAFYTISTGGLPVMPGDTASGFMLSAIATPISVEVVINTWKHFLELYLNGALQQQITVTTSGIYSFAAVSILSTDDIEIKLTV